LDLPHSLLGQIDFMTVSELLSSQGRSKIGVMLSQDPHNLFDQGCLEATVPGPVAMLGDQADRPLGQISDHQSLNLSNRQA
jgi:hypothetical protein